MCIVEVKRLKLTCTTLTNTSCIMNSVKGITIFDDKNKHSFVQQLVAIIRDPQVIILQI